MRYVFPILLWMIFSSCSESFVNTDPKDFNSSLSTRADLQSEEELMKAYYNFPVEEGPQNIRITSRKVDQNRSEITMIHDKMQDDSQKALKIIMLAEKTSEGWYIHEIKRNWQCWPGRGHEGWGTEFCN